MSHYFYFCIIYPYQQNSFTRVMTMGIPRYARNLPNRAPDPDEEEDPVDLDPRDRRGLVGAVCLLRTLLGTWQLPSGQG